LFWDLDDKIVARRIYVEVGMVVEGSSGRLVVGEELRVEGKVDGWALIKKKQGRIRCQTYSRVRERIKKKRR
jgi:hypothetical protein